MKGYKIFTHDLRSPFRFGAPVWDGTLPVQLPRVSLDISDAECGSGWNFVREIKTGLSIVGMWPDGWPSRVFAVEATGDVVERGDKLRTDGLAVLREVPEGEINDAIRDMSSVFYQLAGDMARSQIAWRRALARQHRDERRVEAGLRKALSARGLEDWDLVRYESASAVQYASHRSTWDSRDAWDSMARDAWSAWDSRAGKAAKIAESAWAGRAGKAARDARSALAVELAARNRWIDAAPGLLASGLIDAYEYGLGVALPTGPQELGWLVGGENA